MYLFASSALGIIGWTIFVILLVLVFIFEIWMIISAITNNKITGTAKALWVIGMLLIHPIVAIIYYFTDFKKVK